MRLVCVKSLTLRRSGGQSGTFPGLGQRSSIDENGCEPGPLSKPFTHLTSHTYYLVTLYIERHRFANWSLPGFPRKMPKLPQNTNPPQIRTTMVPRSLCDGRQRSLLHVPQVMRDFARLGTLHPLCSRFAEFPPLAPGPEFSKPIFSAPTNPRSCLEKFHRERETGYLTMVLTSCG